MIKYPEGALVISASQDETFDRCERLWWLTKGGPLRLKEPKRGTQEFGTVLHGVIERYLKAGELGLTDDELYPVGWDAEVTKLDAALIKELFQKAVDQGVIARLPGQLIEHEFNEVIEPGKIYFTGKIDIMDLQGIQDHKSTKAMKYAKTPLQLASNGQMLKYAMAYIRFKEKRGEPLPPTIQLRHNVFSKDPSDKRIKIVKTEIAPAEAIHHWNVLVTETIPKMLLVKEVKNWYEIPDPKNPHEACNAYGGCTFRALCGRRETIEQTIRRYGAQTPTKKDTPTMSLMDRIKSQQPGQPAATRAPLPINPPAAAAAAIPRTLPDKPQVVATRQVEKAQVGVPPPQPEPPPWALPTCMACDGVGFNSKGAPCRICDNTRAQNNGIQSKMFTLDTTTEGHVTWTPKAEWIEQLKKLDYAIDGGEHDVTGEEEVEIQEVEAEPEGDDNGEIEVDEVVDELPLPPKRGRGRPRKDTTVIPAVPAKTGFVLWLGASKRGNMGEVVYMEEIVARFGAELAQASKHGSFYEWDVWQRRDALASCADEVSRRCAGKSVVVAAMTKDNQSLVEALMSRAKDVFVADGFVARVQ